MRYTHFSKTERLELSVLLTKGYSLRAIGRALNRSPSSVSRELHAHEGNKGYDPHRAQVKARTKRQNSKYQGMKVRTCSWLESFVKERLEAGWTPDQIAGRLRTAHCGRTIISAKGIYKWLYSVWGTLWCQYLPSRQYRRQRRRRRATRICIPHRRFIEERPLGATRRRQCGHFEGDTLGVPQGTHETVVGVVDRASRYFRAIKIERRAAAVEGYRQVLAGQTVRSLTLDNGVEHIRYEELAVPTFFSHPYRAWEKPVIENTFQRLRRFIPKRARLNAYSDTRISAIVGCMNRMPRKCLGYRTPEEVFTRTSIMHNHRIGCCI